MKIYKKLFAYVQDKKYLGVLAIIFSAISALLTVYGYYLIYKFRNVFTYLGIQA
ncbi:ABC transporter ATP-binding protein/permease [Streptococcus pneumoniae]|nr:ABC transporter ATP-binding protein/permease [Streptococcus pneumoniae]